MGASFYQFVYPEDLPLFVQSIKQLLIKGHCRSMYYRLFAANNDAIIWVQTEATSVMHTTRGHRGQYIICVHHIIAHDIMTSSFTIDTTDKSLGVKIKCEIDHHNTQLGMIYIST